MNVLRARTMKYLLVMVISVAMVFATISPALAATDISGHWAQTVLEKWARDGLILGYPDGTMKPDEAVSRAEFVVFLNRASKAVNPNATSSFADVQRGDWFYADVASAAVAGYVFGYEDGTFRPSAPITREESAVIVGRALGLTAGDTSTLSSFKDSSTIASWAKGAVAALCAKGIMKGYEDGTFGPSRAISRAETVVILDRGIVEPTLVVVVPVIPSTGGGGGGHAAPSISTVRTVTATNGTVTVTLDRVPGTAPVIGDFAVTQAIGGGTATVVTPSAISTAAAVVTLTVPTVAAGEAQQSVVISVRYKGGAAVPATAFTVAALPAPTVTLADTILPAFKTATVAQTTRYTGATKYKLLKEDGITELCDKRDLGTSVDVTGISVGDTCKVEFYDAGGTWIGTASVVTTAAIGVTRSATVTLGATILPSFKTATVTQTGYIGATQYRLLKADGVTGLCAKRDLTTPVDVTGLIVGDTCKVQFYNSADVLLGTETVVTTATADQGSGSMSVTLAATILPTFKTATVTQSGYIGAAKYKLLKADGVTELCDVENLADPVDVTGVNVGDTVTVQLFDVGGVWIATGSATTTAVGSVTHSATVTLRLSASGLSYVATVSLVGYDGATYYILHRASDNFQLTENVPVGQTVGVIMVTPGDSVKVEVHNASGIMGTETVVAQEQ